VNLDSDLLKTLENFVTLLMLGTLLDKRYRISQNLGSGGFGITYIAEDTKLPGNPICVVKQFKPLSNDPNTLQVARRLFVSEAQVLQQLGNHDQIPRLLAYFEENQEFYLVQEFIDGHPLNQEIILGKPWTESDVIALLIGILETLDFVHENQIIHRDIKPSNLIRRRLDNKIVLIDFGAVKQLTVAQVNNQGDTVFTIGIGTPYYMPSEQVKGTPKLSSDIYAVGILAIQALTGLKPEQLTEDRVTGEIIWRHHVDVSNKLADIIDKMVLYDFRQRYQSAVETLHIVKQLVSPKRPKIGWKFWRKWVFGNVFGIASGGFLGYFVRGLIYSPEPFGFELSNKIGGAFGGIVSGALVGLIQSYILKEQLFWSRWLAVGWVLTNIFVTTVLGATFGGGILYQLQEHNSLFIVVILLSGIFQFLILRQQVSQAGWWVFGTTLGTIIAGFLGQFVSRNYFSGIESAVIFGAIFGFVLSAITGLVLVILLRLQAKHN
jgi:predicted Ser/Thr protein kinase